MKAPAKEDFIVAQNRTLEDELPGAKVNLADIVQTGKLVIKVRVQKIVSIRTSNIFCYYVLAAVQFITKVDAISSA